ncbi:MAG: UDP-N-acetylglucosamine 1-carboxyvinyltransferase [Planctomycetota bacterium]|nr:UDP-N-acetylglucosamine 1-carboxyvinyltransferase [Planctomycetota bacterium]
MDAFLLEGGNPLNGVVSASGSKNAALPMMAAALLLEGECSLQGVPQLRDVDTMRHLLNDMGDSYEAPYDWVRQMRASVCVLGPLLARYGRAIVALPGGCVLGPRPVDLHLRGLEALGATIRVENGCIHAEAKSGLSGATIDLLGPAGPTVLGTANILMAATLANGRTTIQSAAQEPEVVELANYLNACGADIQGQGTSRIQVEGVASLKAVPWRLPPDRIEAGTILLAGAITRGHLRVNQCRPEEMTELLNALAAVGVPIQQGSDWVEVKPGNHLAAHSIQTGAYPGFPTDLQAQWMAFSTRCEGTTCIEEKIYPERFVHAEELNRLGAQIKRKGASALLAGPRTLSGAPVLASDLRASAALVLAGLIAEGETLVRRVYHLDRGYEKLEEKLESVGAKVRRVVDSNGP